MIVKNFSYPQNYQNRKDMESFLFFDFFPLHIYNSNTNSQIIVGVHLMKKARGIMCNSLPWLIWFILPKNLAFIYLFMWKYKLARLDPHTTWLI